MIIPVIRGEYTWQWDSRAERTQCCDSLACVRVPARRGAVSQTSPPRNHAILFSFAVLALRLAMHNQNKNQKQNKNKTKQTKKSNKRYLLVLCL